MAFPEHKKQFLNAVGFTPDEIKAVEDTFDTMSTAAKQQNLRNKEQSEATPPAQQPVVTSQPAVQPQPQEPNEDQLKQAQEFLVKAMEPVLNTLNARIDLLEKAIQHSQAPVNTPAASLAAKSITEQTGDHVLSGRNPDKTPKENNADKEGSAQKVTGIQFLDNILALNNRGQYPGSGS